MNNTHGTFIVSWDFTHGADKAILLVGSQASGKMEVVNTFSGQEAIDIYEKLSNVKEAKNG